MWDLIVSVPDHCLSFYFVGWSPPSHMSAALQQGMQSCDSCVQRETSSSITLLPTGTIKVQVKSCAW